MNVDGEAEHGIIDVVDVDVLVEVDDVLEVELVEEVEVLVLEVDVEVLVEVDDVEVLVEVEVDVVDVDVEVLVDEVEVEVDVEVVDVLVNAALSDIGLFRVMLGEGVAPLYAPGPDPLHELNAYPDEGDCDIVTCDPAFSHPDAGDTEPPEGGDADIVRKY